jgi:hypothetical protein
MFSAKMLIWALDETIQDQPERYQTFFNPTPSQKNKQTFKQTFKQTSKNNISKNIQKHQKSSPEHMPQKKPLETRKILGLRMPWCAVA